MDPIELLRNFAGFFVILLFSLCFHEYAHGLVAKWKGDRTAEMMGRLTMNPTPHMDMIGTVFLPMITIVMNSMGGAMPLFGWAKPVPVNPRNLKNETNDMFWIALAGPLSNILLAVVGTVLLIIAVLTLTSSGLFPGIRSLVQQFIVVNLFLAFFNLIPLHPLDGGKVLARFLPRKWNDMLEENQHITSIVLLMLLVMGGLKWLAVPVQLSYQALITIAGSVFL